MNEHRKLSVTHAAALLLNNHQADRRASAMPHNTREQRQGKSNEELERTRVCESVSPDECDTQALF